jgi:hypothetical protein
MKVRGRGKIVNLIVKSRGLGGGRAICAVTAENSRSAENVMS